MSDQIEIRRLQRGDEPLLARGARLFDAPLKPDAIERFLSSADHHLLLGLIDGLPVGFVTGVELTHPDKGVEMFLYELAVDEPVRRRGVGRALVEALAGIAGERGCYGMWVLTDEDNEAAVATYRRAGATADERTFLLEWRFG